MPNWCDNELTVVGQTKDVSAFVDENRYKNEPGDLSFEASVPQPDTLKDEEWYDWNCQHWGTKWNLNADSTHLEVINSGFRAEYNFSTAWSPPQAWLIRTSALYPSLCFQLDWTEEDEQVPHTEYYWNGSGISEEEFTQISEDALPSFRSIRIESAEKVAF
jgi:hypothetical protein